MAQNVDSSKTYSFSCSKDLTYMNPCTRSFKTDNVKINRNILCGLWNTFLFYFCMFPVLIIILSHISKLDMGIYVFCYYLNNGGVYYLNYRDIEC